MTAKELREKRAKLVAVIGKLRDAITAENRDFNTEEKAEWDKVNAEYNSLSRQIEAAERFEAVTAEQNQRLGPVGLGVNPGQPANGDGATAVNDTHRSLAMAAWCSVQMGGQLTEAQQEACRLTGLHPHAPQLAMRLYNTQDANTLQSRFRQVHHNRAVQHVQDFRATMTIGSGPSGGYLVAPETLIRNLEVNMLAFGGVRQVAETIRTASGERLSWPTADDTSNTGAQLGESVSIGSSVDPSLGKVFWDAYKFSSKPILVPFELLQDGVFDLPGLIGNLFGERLGRITNTKYTTGTGAATPKGIVTAATSFSAASATAIAGDDILGLVHSVDPAYRSGAGFMMHDSILLALRKLKDGNGMYLWQSGMRDGVPDMLLGYPITNNQDMDSSVSSGKKTILFGKLSAYKIRTVGDMRMYRLQERYRDTDQDGFIALIREDGNLLTAGTAPIKYLSH